jgi:hypothetical protein
MNGKLAVNIDEEALFEVLVAANFAPPARKTTVSVPANLTDSTPEATWILPALPDPGNQNPPWATR